MAADLAELGISVETSSVARATADLDRLSAAAGSAAQAATGVGQGYDATAAAMSRAAAGTSQLASGLTRATQAANENARAVGLTRHEYVNLGYQISDVVASAASGASAFTIFAQQGGQIIPVLAQAGGRLGGVFGQIVDGAAAAAGRVGLVGGAIGGLTGALVAAVAAQQSYSATQVGLAQNLSGVGRASGATAEQINSVAAASASAGNVSVREARAMAGQFASTGLIGAEMYGKLIGTAKDFAATTGQDLPEATKELAQAFSDPAKGADALNAKLGFLNDTTRENIQRLQAQGDRLSAQRALVDAYSSSLTKASELTSNWSRVTAAAGNAISDVWDRLGGAVDRAVTGGTLEQRLSTAQARLAQVQGQRGVLGGLFSGRADAEAQGVQAEITRLQGEIQRRDAQSVQAQQNRLSTEIGNTVRTLNPNAERLKAVEDQAQKIRDNLTRLPLDEQGDARRALDGLNAQAKQLREDMKAGGSEFADAVRNAQFSLRMVGASPTGRGLAEVERAAEERRLQLDRSNLNPGERLAQEYANEQVRQADLARVRAETTLQANQSGGAFSRAPQAIQQQILSAVGQFPTVDPNVLAGLLEKESGFRPTGRTRILNAQGEPASTAYGLGQITVGAERDIRGMPGMAGFDRTSPETQVLGAAAYYSLRLRQAGGNQIAALDGYGTGPGYGVDVLRRAGRLGDASQQAGALQVDAARRAAEAQGQQLQNVTENYGRNTVALEANQRAQEQINAAIAAGRTVTGEFAASIRSYETAAASAARQTRITQFGVDMAFEEAQLGRTSREQAGFSRARSLLGETTSPEAQAIAGRTIELNDLKEARSTFQDTASSLVSSLTRGGSAAQAFSNAIGRLGDKLLNIGFDQIGASLFGGSKGGGIGGLFSSIFGGGSGGDASNGLVTGNPADWFADGGIMTSRGAMPLHRYATGGIASSPQVAIFGEGRGPEAYVPLPDGRRIPVAMQGGAANSNGGGITDARTISIDARGSTMTEAQIRGVVVQAITANNQEQYRNQAVQAETYRRLAG